MSEFEDNRADPAELKALSALEAGVGRLLEELSRMSMRTRRAEARVRDLEALLRRFTRGDADPGELQETITELRAENRELKDRIREGRAQVDRLLSRVRFLDEGH